jgi:hypothetical protein
MIGENGGDVSCLLETSTSLNEHYYNDYGHNLSFEANSTEKGLDGGHDPLIKEFK